MSTTPAYDIHQDENKTLAGTTDSIGETIRFWKEYAGVNFSEEDAREMIENIQGVFALLEEWDRRKRSSSQ